MSIDTGTGTGTDKGTGAKKKTGRPKGSKSGYTVTDKVIAGRKKKELALQPKTPEEIDTNTRVINHAIAIQQIAKTVNLKDPESIKAGFANYLVLCQRNGCRVSNVGAAAALGVKWWTITNWSRDGNKEYKAIAETILTACSLIREQLIAEGSINPVIGIFWQRNFDGLRNDTEQTAQAASENENEKISETAQDIRNKYGSLIDE